MENDAGIEMTFAVNHLGYFLTTNMLLDVLKQTPSSRIVVVASDAHFSGQIDMDNLMHENDYRGFSVYCDSKLANLLFTYQLADRLKDTTTTVNAVHPGVIKTKFGVSDRNSDGTFVWGKISPEEGAKASVYLSASEKINGVSGKYFNQMQPEPSSAQSYEMDLASQLWNKSLELTQLRI